MRRPGTIPNTWVILPLILNKEYFTSSSGAFFCIADRLGSLPEILTTTQLGGADFRLSFKCSIVKILIRRRPGNRRQRLKVGKRA